MNLYTCSWMWQFDFYALYIREFADGTWTAETVFQIAAPTTTMPMESYE